MLPDGMRVEGGLHQALQGGAARKEEAGLSGADTDWINAATTTTDSATDSATATTTATTIRGNTDHKN